MDNVNLGLTALDATGRLYMLGFLNGLISCDGNITPAQWRAAYGVAVDEQTVRQIRTDLDLAVA